MIIKLKYILFVITFNTITCFCQNNVGNDIASEITFKTKKLGVKVKGNFNDFKVLSNFNSNDLEDSFINLEIMVNSIYTASKIRDKYLLNSKFFDVKNHPKIIFESSEIEKSLNSDYIIKGSLQIKGIKKNVETPLEIEETETGLLFHTDFIINRKDFDIGGNSVGLSKQVYINLTYVADRN
jgi:polyisoprenoid-binding protein YceI